jgi:hypothetical protein
MINVFLHDTTHMMLSACAYFSGCAITSCTKQANFLQANTYVNLQSYQLANLAITTEPLPYFSCYFLSHQLHVIITDVVHKPMLGWCSDEGHVA